MDAKIVDFRKAMATRAAADAASIPSFLHFVKTCQDCGMDGDFVVELAAMGEEETTAALLIRAERWARAYADAVRELRVLLVAAYGADMRRREEAGHV